MRTNDKVLMKLFQKFPGLDGVQGFKLVLVRALRSNSLIISLSILQFSININLSIAFNYGSVVDFCPNV